MVVERPSQGLTGALVPADHLGADEAALDVGVDHARGVPDAQATLEVPGLRGLVLAGGEERDQVEQRERPADDRFEPRLRQAELVSHRRRLGRREL